MLLNKCTSTHSNLITIVLTYCIISIVFEVMFNKREARVLSEYKRSRAAPSTFCTLIKHYFSFIKHYIQHYIRLYDTKRHYATLYNSIQDYIYDTIIIRLYGTIRHHTTLYKPIQQYIRLYDTVRHYTTLYKTI